MILQPNQCQMSSSNENAYIIVCCESKEKFWVCGTNNTRVTCISSMSIRIEYRSLGLVQPTIYVNTCHTLSRAIGESNVSSSLELNKAHWLHQYFMSLELFAFRPSIQLSDSQSFGRLLCQRNVVLSRYVNVHNTCTQKPIYNMVCIHMCIDCVF